MPRRPRRAHRRRGRGQPAVRRASGGAGRRRRRARRPAPLDPGAPDRARSRRCPSPSAQVVGVAAVAGRDFPVAAVEALVGRPIGDELDRLAQRELVEPTVAGRQQFGHALLQEAAYGADPEAAPQRAAHAPRPLARRRRRGRRGGRRPPGARLPCCGRSSAEADDDGRGSAPRPARGWRPPAAAPTRWAIPRRATRLLQRALALLPDRSGPAGRGDDRARRRRLEPAHERGGAAPARRRAPSSPPSTACARSSCVPASCGSAPSRRARRDAPTDAEVLAETEAALRELEHARRPARPGDGALHAGRDASARSAAPTTRVASARRALGVLQAADEDTVWAALDPGVGARRVADARAGGRERCSPSSWPSSASGRRCGRS